MTKVRRHFSKEFLSRLFNTVLFYSLGKSQLEKIDFKAIERVKRQLVVLGMRIILESSGQSVFLMPVLIQST
jgi:ATP-dependent Clp protease ATP-binding subunit ClpA